MYWPISNYPSSRWSVVNILLQSAELKLHEPAVIIAPWCDTGRLYWMRRSSSGMMTVGLQWQCSCGDWIEGRVGVVVGEVLNGRIYDAANGEGIWWRSVDNARGKNTGKVKRVTRDVSEMLPAKGYTRGQHFLTKGSGEESVFEKYREDSQ